MLFVAMILSGGMNYRTIRKCALHIPWTIGIELHPFSESKQSYSRRHGRAQQYREQHQRATPTDSCSKPRDGVPHTAAVPYSVPRPRAATVHDEAPQYSHSSAMVTRRGSFEGRAGHLQSHSSRNPQCCSTTLSDINYEVYSGCRCSRVQHTMVGICGVLF